LCGKAVCQVPAGLNLVGIWLVTALKLGTSLLTLIVAALLNYSAFTRQVQLGRSTASRGITILLTVSCQLNSHSTFTSQL